MADGSPVRIRYRITATGIGFIVIAICILFSSFLQQVNLLVLIFALMFAPALLSLMWTRSNVRNVTARRRLPQDVFAGQPCVVGIEVTSGKRWASTVAVSVLEAVEPAVPGSPVTVPVPNIPPQGSRHVQFQLVVHRRGVYRFAAPTILTRFPFGLAECRLTGVCPPAEIVVFPQLGELSWEWQSVTGPAPMIGQGRQPFRASNPDELHSLREYRPGDNPRHIHWRTSARKGELIVKLYESSEVQDHLLFLDLWVPARPGSQDLESVERLVSFAASVSVDLCHRPNHRLTIAIAAEKPVVRVADTSSRLPRALLVELSHAEASNAADVAQLLNELAVEVRTARRVLLVSTRPPGEQENSWMRASGLRPEGVFLKRLNVAAGDLDRYFSIEMFGNSQT